MFRPLPLILTVATTTLVLLASRDAAASDKNVAVQACSMKQPGQACSTTTPFWNAAGVLDYRDQAGTCANEECCELDYSKGSPPQSVCGPCLACQAGPAAPAPSDSSAEGGSPGEPPRSAPGDDPPASAGSQRGCRVGGGLGSAWSGLLVLAGLFAMRRRR